MTWLHNGNYGTLLQAYGLQRYLRNQGYDVNNIDFSPSVKEKVKNLVKNKNSLSLFKEKWEAYLTKKKADQSKLNVRNKRFDEFLKKNFNLTEAFYNPESLTDLKNRFDLYICGSDQIWSPMLLNPSYYFDYLDSSHRKASYACSFGVNKIPDNKKDKIKNLLNSFEEISVRENQGAEIVKDLLKREVPVLVDPTLLLCEDEWNTLIENKPLVKDKYIFAYFLTYNKDYFEKAEKIAKEKNCKLVVVPSCKESYSINGEIIQDAGPEEWVNLVANSEMVVTDSFHGCVFSLIYKRQFMVFKRFSDNSSKSQNSRVYTLLNEYNLENHLIEADTDISGISITSSDYERIHEKISLNAQKSEEWLEKLINKG